MFVKFIALGFILADAPSTFHTHWCSTVIGSGFQAVWFTRTFPSLNAQGVLGRQNLPNLQLTLGKGKAQRGGVTKHCHLLSGGVRCTTSIC